MGLSTGREDLAQIRRAVVAAQPAAKPERTINGVPASQYNRERDAAIRRNKDAHDAARRTKVQERRERAADREVVEVATVAAPMPPERVPVAVAATMHVPIPGRCPHSAMRCGEGGR